MRDQILEYLRDCAQRFGILPHTRLSCELLAATWPPTRSTGSSRPRQARSPRGCCWRRRAPQRAVDSRTCPASRRPAGNAFHTANWDHSDDLTGKRVALLGSGATAVQVVPEIQPRLARLHLFQRTPPWVIPTPTTRSPAGCGSCTGARRCCRSCLGATVYALRESMAVGITRDKRWLKAQELNARLPGSQVPDPELRARLTPDYEIFCKRIILSNRWYPALQAPNVELVSSGVQEIREHSVVDGDGVEREIDTLIFATGFKPAELPIAERIRGRDGSSLAELWQGSPQAYLGTTVAGFPNLLFYGPNLNLGHSSIVYMLESQIAYALDALRTMRLRRAANSTCARRSRPPTTRRLRSGSPGRSGTPAAAAAGTSTATAATRSMAGLHVRVPPPHTARDAESYRLSVPVGEPAAAAAPAA